MGIKVFGIAGFKNSGKTTLVTDLVHELCRRGLRVGTVKHAHHDFDIDHPGKDSYQHRLAGAEEVIVASARRWAHISELGESREPALDELIEHFGDLDIVLVEGYKRGSHPKLEVRREGIAQLDATMADRSVIAIVTDRRTAEESVPVFMRNELTVIADFVLANAVEII